MRAVGGPASVSRQASSGTNSGIVARQSAATPEGTNCSSCANRPWHPTKNSIPTIAEPPHSRAEGNGAPRSATRHIPSRMAPPIRHRIAIIDNGGIVSTAQAIARKVDPHTKYTAANAASTGSRDRSGTTAR